MEQYKIIKKIGDGTYGSVFKAINNVSGEVVAIKKFKCKYNSWDECVSLREVKALNKLSHQNIVKLKEMFKVDDEFYIVFEYLEKNIFEHYIDYRKRKQRIPEERIKLIIKQILEGLSHMHQLGFFHRDLKPENILIQQDTVKICDFGLARETSSQPPFTDYVATRWYRAPEILLKQRDYSCPVDIFALGCIMAELYTLSPIFEGNNEIDQINKIFSTLGTPSSKMWPEGVKLAKHFGILIEEQSPVHLRELLKTQISQEAFSMIQDMLNINPLKRPTAQQLLQHPFLSHNILDFENTPSSIDFTEGKYSENKEFSSPDMQSCLKIMDSVIEEQSSKKVTNKFQVKKILLNNKNYYQQPEKQRVNHFMEGDADGEDQRLKKSALFRLNRLQSGSIHNNQGGGNVVTNTQAAKAQPKQSSLAPTIFADQQKQTYIHPARKVEQPQLPQLNFKYHPQIQIKVQPTQYSNYRNNNVDEYGFNKITKAYQHN